MQGESGMTLKDEDLILKNNLRYVLNFLNFLSILKTYTSSIDHPIFTLNMYELIPKIFNDLRSDIQGIFIYYDLRVI